MLSLCECTFAFKSGEVEGLKRINRVHINLFRNKFSLSLVFENYARSRGRRTRWKNSCGCLQIDLLVLVVTRFLSRHGSLSLSLRVSFFSHDSSLTFQKLSSSIRSKENSDAFRAESCKRLLLLISAFFEFSKIEKKRNATRKRYCAQDEDIQSTDQRKEAGRKDKFER